MNNVYYIKCTPQPVLKEQITSLDFIFKVSCEDGKLFPREKQSQAE
jgi:hypothetical protein